MLQNPQAGRGQGARPEPSHHRAQAKRADRSAGSPHPHRSSLKKRAPRDRAPFRRIASAKKPSRATAHQALRARDKAAHGGSRLLSALIYSIGRFHKCNTPHSFNLYARFMSPQAMNRPAWLGARAIGLAAQTPERLGFGRTTPRARL